MYTRKQLQIAQCSRLRMKFFRNTVIYAFKFKWMVIHKPHHIFFIFFFCNRTGTENQHSARFHILCCLIKDRSLENDQFIFFLGCRAVFDLRFLAYHTVTGTRYICKNNICLAFGFYIKQRSILYFCLHIDRTCSLNIFFDQIYLVLADIACVYCTKSFHLITHMKTLATRCSTHVNDIISSGRICNLRHKHGTYILYKDFSLNKCIQRQNMVISGNTLCIRKIWSRFDGNALIFQAVTNFINRIQICTAANRDRFFPEEICKHFFGNFLAVIFQPAIYKLLRHGITNGQITDKILFS